MRIVYLILALGVLGISNGAFGEETGEHAPTKAGHHAEGLDVHHDDPTPQPILPRGAVWPGVTLILIGAAFVAAMLIGPIIRANTPEALPETHSHDEHGHGHGADAHAHAPAAHH